MSNASLKEQLEAMASQLSDTVRVVDAGARKDMSKEIKPKQHFRPAEKVRPAAKVRPVETAKRPKPKWLEFAQYGVELLQAYFPEGFKGVNDVKPLKKGIKQDVVKRLSTIENIVTEDKACMVKSLAYYVNTAAYHKSVVEGATRIDLDGQPAGVVTPEEAKYSIDRHQAKLQAKQAAAQQLHKQLKSKEEVTS